MQLRWQGYNFADIRIMAKFAVPVAGSGNNNVYFSIAKMLCIGIRLPKYSPRVRIPLPALNSGSHTRKRNEDYLQPFITCLFFFHQILNSFGT